MLLPALVLLLLLNLAAHDAHSAANDPGKPRVGLALSAGAARGLAHVGVLEALEEAGIPIDCIAGTSMGTVIGALYASGYSAQQIENIVRSVDWQQVFSSKPERPLVPLAQRIDLSPVVARVGLDSWKIQLPRAVESDYRINRLLIKLLAGPDLAIGGDFDKLPIPFRAVAADLRTGERVVLSRGNLARAVRASMSVPVKLLPVESGEQLLIDGGIVDALPVDVARAMDADIVIAVDTRLPPLTPEKYRDAIGMAVQVVDILARARNADFAQSADVTITPDLEGISVLDYEKSERVIARGRESGRNAIEQIRERIGKRLGEGAAPMAGGTGSRVERSSSYVIADIRVEGNRKVRAKHIRKTFGLRQGRPFDLDTALRGVDALHATRLFDSIWLDFEPTGPSDLVVTVVVTETWRWTAEIGAAYNEADQVGGFLRLRNRNIRGWGESFDLTMMASDSRLGARGQLSADRLLTPAVGFFARGYVFEEKPRVFRDHDQLGRAEFDVSGAAMGLQRQIGHSLLLRTGFGIERISTRVPPGIDFAAARDRITDLHALVAWDRLDDRSFPSRGEAARVLAERSRLRDLDAARSRDYRRVIASARGAFPIGRRNIIDAQLLAGGSSGDVPVYKLVRIGGPLVPGLHRDELWGPQALAGGIGHSFILWRELRLTARAGAGNVWQARDEISTRAMRAGFGLALESPTRLGPVSLMWGRSDLGDSRIYFSAGFLQDRPE